MASSDSLSETESPARHSRPRRRSSHTDRRDDAFERIASPARDFLSVGGLFEMDDELDLGSPMLQAAPERRASSEEKRDSKRRGVKHLREIPAEALLEVLGDVQGTRSLSLDHNTAAVAPAFTSSAVRWPVAGAALLERLSEEAEEEERMEAESCASTDSGASGETAVKFCSDGRMRTCGACDCSDCRDSLTPPALRRRAPSGGSRPATAMASATGLSKTVPMRVCPCCVCCRTEARRVVGRTAGGTTIALPPPELPPTPPQMRI